MFLLWLSDQHCKHALKTHVLVDPIAQKQIRQVFFCCFPINFAKLQYKLVFLLIPWPKNAIKPKINENLKKNLINHKSPKDFHKGKQEENLTSRTLRSQGGAPAEFN